MAQIKIYALNKTIKRHRDHLSIAIHQALTKTLKYPIEKKFQRFISLESEHFIYPSDRTESYIIIEISMFEGRTKEAKKALINTLFQNINDLCGIDFNDIEITIFETPKENWGIRGKNADELQLNYQINI
ncbi:tautomerase family protein [Acinetobacter sp. BSP-153]|jgi:4-oxalocrotonate tautomerase family enzyme|uniref:tautomerase family protein n=1 Tax=unclassified Acinetobacter TaxID=196816 RepID=UPI000A351340|nr:MULTISPECIES: tautomerase family protein [unclassified Acinetobacter]OTG59460.1 tautomerase family protein [Acinetobacter sp. ANC 4204]RGD92609.1 tautomerase family protein [Acinetobacter sp. SWAC57]